MRAGIITLQWGRVSGCKGCIRPWGVGKGSPEKVTLEPVWRMNKNDLRGALGWGRRDHMAFRGDLQRIENAYEERGCLGFFSPQNARLRQSLFPDPCIVVKQMGQPSPHPSGERGHQGQPRGHSLLTERKFLTGRALGWVPVVLEAGQVPCALALETKDSSWRLCWEGEGGGAD